MDADGEKYWPTLDEFLAGDAMLEPDPTPVWNVVSGPYGNLHQSLDTDETALGGHEPHWSLDAVSMDDPFTNADLEWSHDPTPFDPNNNAAHNLSIGPASVGNEFSSQNTLSQWMASDGSLANGCGIDVEYYLAFTQTPMYANDCVDSHGMHDYYPQEMPMLAQRMGPSDPQHIQTGGASYTVAIDTGALASATESLDDTLTDIPHGGAACPPQELTAVDTSTQPDTIGLHFGDMMIDPVDFPEIFAQSANNEVWQPFAGQPSTMDQHAAPAALAVKWPVGHVSEFPSHLQNISTGQPTNTGANAFVDLLPEHQGDQRENAALVPSNTLENCSTTVQSASTPTSLLPTAKRKRAPSSVGAVEPRKKSKVEASLEPPWGYSEFSLGSATKPFQHNVRKGKKLTAAQKATRIRGACIPCRHRKVPVRVSAHRLVWRYTNISSVLERVLTARVRLVYERW